jgi:hypothetical protein
MQLTTEEAFSRFEGRYSGSFEIPDLTLKLDCFVKTKPILFLLSDTGVQAAESTPVEVSYSISDNNPQIWAGHSRGHTAEIFGCLKKMDSDRNSEALFALYQRLGVWAYKLILLLLEKM